MPVIVVGYAGVLSALLPAHANAEELTAAGLLQKMDDRQQYAYIAGVVAGLGTARYVRDGNDAGSACIDRWFYDTAGIRQKIYDAFTRFGDKSPSAILYALVTRECGK